MYSSPNDVWDGQEWRESLDPTKNYFRCPNLSIILILRLLDHLVRLRITLLLSYSLALDKHSVRGLIRYSPRKDVAFL